MTGPKTPTQTILTDDCYTYINYKEMMNSDTTIVNPYNNIVNVAEYYEVEYWTNKFGVSPEQLKSAVKAVGVSAEAIATYLNNKTLKAS